METSLCRREYTRARDSRPSPAAAASPSVRHTTSETQNLLWKFCFPLRSESSCRSFSGRASQSHDKNRSAEAFSPNERNSHQRHLFSRRQLPATLCTLPCTSGFCIRRSTNPEYLFRCDTNTPESPFQSPDFANALASPNQSFVACIPTLPCPHARNYPWLLRAPRSKAEALRKSLRSSPSPVPSACTKHLHSIFEPQFFRKLPSRRRGNVARQR